MMQNIDYLLMNPTGNLTILVRSEVPKENQSLIAEQLLKMEQRAEQVGFLSAYDSADIALRMAGGEFCGNAAMCAAVFFGMQKKLPQGQITVHVSGAEKPVSVSVEDQRNGSWSGIVEMPKPNSISRIQLPDGSGYPLVSFSGISHVIIEEPLPRDQAEKLAINWCKEFGLDAIGLMFLNSADKRLTPLVYVPEVNTLYWESACASGTTAVGAWMSKEQNGSVCAALHQPGGTLKVTASPNGPLYLHGNVSFLAEKKAYISL